MLRIHDLALELIRQVAPLAAVIGRHDPDLAKQLRRALTSVPLNIAEGVDQRGGAPDLALFHRARIGAGGVVALRTGAAWGYTEAPPDTVRAQFDHVIGALHILSHHAEPRAALRRPAKAAERGRMRGFAHTDTRRISPRHADSSAGEALHRVARRFESRLARRSRATARSAARLDATEHDAMLGKPERDPHTGARARATYACTCACACPGSAHARARARAHARAPLMERKTPNGVKPARRVVR